MIEILIHGRGGQGAVTAAKILEQAILNANPEMIALQASGFYGPERGGAPTIGFVRADLANKSKRIRKRGPVKNPDYVIVLDSALLQLQQVSDSVRVGKTKKALINTAQGAENFDLGAEVAVLDGQKIADECGLGKNVNTALLGAFVKITELTTLEALLFAIESGFGRKIEENKKAARLGYEWVKTECCGNCFAKGGEKK